MAWLRTDALGVLFLSFGSQTNERVIELFVDSKQEQAILASGDFK